MQEHTRAKIHKLAEAKQGPNIEAFKKELATAIRAAFQEFARNTVPGFGGWEVIDQLADALHKDTLRVVIAPAKEIEIRFTDLP